MIEVMIEAFYWKQNNTIEKSRHDKEKILFGADNGVNISRSDRFIGPE